MPEDVFVFAERRTIYKCTDLMVHPAHQRRGLAKRIIDLLNYLTRPFFPYSLPEKAMSYQLLSA